MAVVELEPGESITKSVRKHWLVLIGSLLPFAILGYLPILLFSGLAGLLAKTPALYGLLTFDAPGMRLLLGIWWLFMWLGAFSAVIRYLLTEWVITTTRIIDVHQYGFFRRQISSALLNRVQDVTTDTEGLFETLFGFGRLEVESAGAQERFVMDGIAHPAVLRDLIMGELAALHADGSPKSGV